MLRKDELSRAERQANREANRGLSPLGLSEPEIQYNDRSILQLIEDWPAKALHVRYPGCIEKEVNKMLSLTYLRARYLYPKTEGQFLAI